MLFSYSWLKELSGTKRSPQKLAELLLTHAFEVESATKYKHSLERVVIGKVLSVSPHPHADRLRVAKVSVGKKEVCEIVCGAPNLALHQKVVVALPGARLPGGIVIKETELRGVKSAGMICSAKELGMGNDHTGILILPTDAPIGKDFALHAGLDDVVMDIKILPDRSCDALSYRGLAHEIAALEGSRPAFLKEVSPTTGYQLKKGGKAPKITLLSDRCKRYIAMTLPKIHMATTPLPVQVRLVLSGLRPISPLVDLTNYLMLETGQPIHAFDATRIGIGGIVVRQAKKNEKLTLLDGTVLTLVKDDVVIADKRKVLALAGVMGGKDSGVSDASTAVVFELAYFDAQSIRRTDKRYHLHTDAAYRFERGIDCARPGEVMKLLAERAREWGVGNSFFYREVGEKIPKPTAITLELGAVTSLLGTTIPLFEVVQYMSWLGLSVKKLPNRQALQVFIPLRRPDLRGQEDLIEEIGRMRGYRTIPPQPLPLSVSPPKQEESKQIERCIKTKLADLGFDEVMTYSFYSEKSAVQSGQPLETHLRLANPMNPDQALMRRSLFPGLLRIAMANTSHFSRFALFELGSVYYVGGTEPEEEKRVGMLCFEREAPSSEHSYRFIKGKLEMLFGLLGVPVRFEPIVMATPDFLHPGQAAHLLVQHEPFGSVGVVRNTWTAKYGRKAVMVYAEFSVKLLSVFQHRETVYQKISRFPLAERDISLIGPGGVTYERLLTVIQSAGAPLLRRTELFDVYLLDQEKSFSFHLGFQSDEKTLSSSEMDAAFDAIVEAAKEHLGMRLKL